MSKDDTANARTLASRRNGARSQGPRTAAGKARTARNALKHGLRARRLARRSGATSGGRPWEPAALDDENASEFRAFQAAAQAELAPSGTLQSELVERIVTAAWRARQGDRLEAALLGCHLGPDAPKAGEAQAALGLGLMRDGNGPRALETLVRYRGSVLAGLRAAPGRPPVVVPGARRAPSPRSAAPDAGARIARERSARRRARAPAATPRHDQTNPRSRGKTTPWLTGVALISVRQGRAADGLDLAVEGRGSFRKGGNGSCCEGFRMPAGRDVVSSAEGRRPKASKDKEGTRGGRTRPCGVYGDSTGANGGRRGRGRVRWGRRPAWSARRWRQVWRSVRPRVCMSADARRGEAATGGLSRRPCAARDWRSPTSFVATGPPGAVVW